MANVGNVTSLSGNGLRDWLIQRVSALILAAYTLFLVFFIMRHPDLNYADWYGLYQCLFVKIFTVFALLSIYAHAWVGVWTVLTDYIKPTWLRGFLEVAVILTLLGCLIWGIAILWNFMG